MNKLGFTLIEVLSAIVIIAIIAGIGTVAYTGIMTEVSNKSFERYRDTMHAEAIYYVTNHSDKINWNGDTARIMLSELKVDPINNPKNSKDFCTGSYVDITRSRTSNVLSITYRVCLVCPNTDFDSSFELCKEYEN